MTDRRVMSPMSLIAVILIIAASFYAVPAGSCAEEPRGIGAEAALVLLKEGNGRFAGMRPLHPDQTAERRQKTASEGQAPFAAVLACSDSRVPVEAIFDRGIGDIFVIRVAGNTATGASVIGSAEYASGHLGVGLIVVMAHTQCGAVAAAVSGAPLEGSVADIVKDIAPVAKRVAAREPNLTKPELIDAVAGENAIQARSDLLLNSEELAEAVARRKLRIITAMYNIKTGVVEWPDEAAVSGGRAGPKSAK